MAGANNTNVIRPSTTISCKTSFTAALSHLLYKKETNQRAFSLAVASTRGFGTSGLTSQVPGLLTRAGVRPPPATEVGQTMQLALNQRFSSSCQKATTLAGGGSKSVRGGQAVFLAVGASCAARAKEVESLWSLLRAPTVACEDYYVPRVEVVQESEWGTIKRWLRRVWVPIVLGLWFIFGMDHPRLLLANSVLIAWCTKPYAESLTPWLEERRLQQVLAKEGLDQFASQINPLTRLAKVEVEDYVLFQVATASYLHEKLTLVGALGDWWIVAEARPSIIMQTT